MSPPIPDRILERSLGSLVGAGLGMLLLRGPAGALIGSVAGYAIQRGLSRRLGRAGAARGGGPFEVHRQVTDLLRLLVAVARVDGKLTDRRRLAIRSFFQRDAKLPGLALAEIDRIVAVQAAGPAPAPADAARALRPRDPRERAQALFLAHRVAFAEGPMSSPTARELDLVGEHLGLPQAERESIRALFTGGAVGARAEDCEVLGVRPDATEDELQARFKDAAKRHHPDRFQHQGAAAARAAEARFKEIRAAYERLRGAGAPPRGPAVSLCPNCRTFTDAEEALCIRCGETKHEVRDGQRRLRCPFCNQTNAVPNAGVDGVIRCGNCKVVLIR